ncbi:hypothetical protein KVT40_000585 [Elsinoe batatas]|uniref:Uncharacterized protein n=1 Tax=Elsinoe batatas TaxID=2601811 RepID=A0A8K0L9W2_9PEZI|nr:hypothetical protein KVT40_000585 [Elsinoe batatas]
MSGATCAALSHRESRLSTHPTSDDTCGASGARQKKRHRDVPFLGGIQMRSQACPRDCPCGSSNLTAAVVPGRHQDERCTRSVTHSHTNAETLPAAAGEIPACITINCARACWLFLQIFDSAEAKVRTRCH